jgi:hypothetical protein
MATDTKQVGLPMKGRGGTAAASVSHPLVRILELQVPMVLGALVCYLLGRLIPASSSLASVYHPGTYLYAAGDILFLTVPVVAWLIVRGHRRRYSLEMAGAMVAPVAAIVVLGQVAGYDYLRWLVFADYPAMCLGMLGYLLYRPHEHAPGARVGRALLRRDGENG